jgi:hypothetical protein
MDITETLAPRSDQLNADDLVAAPRTVTIVNVTPGSTDQPVNVVTREFGPERPYKPGKSMRRVMGKIWGVESQAWIGKSMTLYCDPEITFGREKLGGIRISHMSGITEAQTINLTITRGKRKPFTVEPLHVGGPVVAPTEAMVATCEDQDILRTWWQEYPGLRAAITARKAELDASEATS